MEGVKETYMYKCTSCEGVYSSLEDINQHQCLGQQHMELFKCSSCEGLYPNIDSFNAHSCPGIVKVEESRPDVTAPQYAATFDEATNVAETLQEEMSVPGSNSIIKQEKDAMNAGFQAQHVTNSREEVDSTPQCPCCEEYLKKGQVKRHVQGHRTLLQCPMCRWPTRTEDGMKFHYHLYHSQAPPPKPPVNLSSTSLLYAQKLNDSANLKPLMGDSYTETLLSSDDLHKDFNCIFCFEKFQTMGEKKKHEWQTHGIRFEKKKRGMFACDERGCRKKFLTKLGLTFHIRHHLGLKLHGMKQFKCRYCKFTFTERRKWKQHSSTHIMKFKCSKCAMLFKSNSQLIFHKRVKHRDLNRMVCHECGKAFHHLPVLQSHNAKIHRESSSIKHQPAAGQPDEDLSMAIFYHCHKCYDIFTNQTALMRHMHSHIKNPHICSCLITFKSKADFLAHCKGNHKDMFKKKRRSYKKKGSGNQDQHQNKFKCDFCPATFDKQMDFILHLDKHVAPKKADSQPVKLNSLDLVSKPTITPKPLPQPKGIKAEPVMGQDPPGAEANNDYCIVTVCQEGEPFPITRDTPSTRILNLEVPPTTGPWTKKKKLLHKSVFELRCTVEVAVKSLLQYTTGLPRSHASHFEEVLAVPSVQKALDNLRNVAYGCSLTLSVPFPDVFHRHVFVNFIMKFGEAGAMTASN